MLLCLKVKIVRGVLMDFAKFVEECCLHPRILLAVLPSLLLMLVNGWTDAPVNIATAIHSGAVKPRVAIIISAVCNFLGAVTMCVFGSSVAVNIYNISGLPSAGEKTLPALTAAVVAVSVWSLAALYFGLPTSESHALMAALSGSAIAVGGFSTFNGAEWLKVLLGIVLSTLPVVAVSYFVAKLFKSKIKLPETTFKKLQVLGAALSSFSHGAQDGQKLAGVLTLAAVLGLQTQSANVKIPLWTVVVAALVISFGTLLGGRKIINTFKEFAPTDPSLGFGSDLVSAVCLTILSAVGLPASTTHAKSSAVFGAGKVDHTQNKDNKAARQMVFAWVLTFPICAVLAWVFTKI